MGGGEGVIIANGTGAAVRTNLQRRRRWRTAALGVLAVTLLACGGDDGGGVASERSEQLEDAARAAGLDGDVAAFLGRAARGALATGTASYPGPTPGTTLRITSRPPDRRVDVLRDGELVEATIVVDGAAHRCTPAGDDDLVCERTDAFVEPPGVFRATALDELVDSLVAQADRFDFAVADDEVAGTDVSCLTTTAVDGSADARLCITDGGVLALVERPGERLEATALSDDVDDGLFVLPDR